MERVIDKIRREKVLLGPTSVVCQPEIQRLCLCPYYNHPKGCPNYGKRTDCPPKTSLFSDVFKEKAYVAAVVFNFKNYLEVKRDEHPDWTERALRNSRHWQGHLRAELKKFVSEELSGCDTVIFNPEAMGVNVTKTCWRVGLKIEWPPKKVVCQVALIGQRRKG